MLSKFNVSKDLKRILKNFSFLSLLQIVQILSSLIVIPYLIKKLGGDVYGVVVYCQSIVAFLGLFITYGFNITVTKQIAENSSDLLMLSKLFWGTIFLKTFIFFLIFIMLLISTYIFPFLGEYREIYILTYIMHVGTVLFPDWFFQGIERMQNITLVMIITKLLAVGIIFLGVNGQSDLLVVPITFSLTMILAGVLGVFIAVKKYQMYLCFPSYDFYKEQLKGGWAYFFSTITANSKDYLNTFLIGVFLNYNAVAIYDLCNKIVKVLVIPASMFSQAVFPKLSREKSLLFRGKVEKVLMIYGIGIALFFWAIPKVSFSSIINGLDFLLFSETLNMFIIMVPLLCLTMSRGVLLLIAFGQSKLFSKSIVYSVLVYLIGFGCLYIFDSINLINLIIIILCSLIVEVICSSLYGYRYIISKIN
ncbi:hypothetical protein AV926_06215 [Myroides marinus]|uniref:Polysaccharide transporter, PST family n=1 Tax=Myroides marinus TaxID=703342 RepID=A0A164A1I0_9FLAO|nr:oligosaccharide flippase family protein [Myroides marinus]KZE82830.1 hypothetical protein AV926_06215 [Myroides marinus]